MLACSFGFRPRRATHDALQIFVDESWRGRRWVVETDIANCFEAIPHQGLMRAVQERVSDQSVLKLLRVMLRAGVMSDGQVRRSVTGTPQGGVISPLMANVYLHRIDRAWDVRRHGVLVRFADDVVVMCATREQAEAALTQLRVLLVDLGLEPKAAKTRIVNLAVGGPGFDFLGFHHRLVRSDGRRPGKRVTFLARWPTDKAMQHARDRIRELTARSRLLLPVEAIVGSVNRFVRGWAAYFRYGNSARRFAAITGYMRMRLALVISKRHQRSRGYGRSVVFFRSPNHLGLIGLDGIVASPRPFREDTKPAQQIEGTTATSSCSLRSPRDPAGTASPARRAGLAVNKHQGGKRGRAGRTYPIRGGSAAPPIKRRCAAESVNTFAGRHSCKLGRRPAIRRPDPQAPPQVARGPSRSDGRFGTPATAPGAPR